MKLAEDPAGINGLMLHKLAQRFLNLERTGLLVAQKPIMHSVNVHERCKKEIEYFDACRNGF